MGALLLDQCLRVAASDSICRLVYVPAGIGVSLPRNRARDMDASVSAARFPRRCARRLKSVIIQQYSVFMEVPIT